MKWRNLTFDWNRARAFLVTAEEGSYSRAAKALGLTQPTLGRQVAGLEEELGVVLFERVGNRLELTGSGLELMDHVRAMGEAAARISLGAAGQAAALDGKVRISASQAVSAYLVAPILSGLRRDYPGIEVEVVVSNDVSDLRRREADIAIRHVRPDDPELLTQKVRETWPAWMYATREYLVRIGDPRSPVELSRSAEIFGFDDTRRMLLVFQQNGFPFEERNFPVVVDDHLVQWEMAKQGLGICVMMEAVGDPEPTVERVLPDCPAPVQVPMWVTSHRELKTSRRMRVVFQRLVETLGA